MKSILIVGASGGIGRIVAAYYLNLGYKVIGTNFQTEFVDKLLSHENFVQVRLDLTDGAQISELSTTLGSLDAIVNCAGVVEFEAYNEPDENMNIWNRTMLVNFTGSYLLFEKLGSKIKEGGSYIMLSSTDSYFGGKVNTAYAASKSGVNSLTKSLALQFQDSKVRVNTIAPGWVETAMMEDGGQPLIDYAESINPLRRNGRPEDVAHLVDFLISDKSSYINGQIITLDGGYTLQDPSLLFEEQQIEQKNTSTDLVA